jgi:hypothetical protein
LDTQLQVIDLHVCFGKELEREKGVNGVQGDATEGSRKPFLACCSPFQYDDQSFFYRLGFFSFL